MSTVSRREARRAAVFILFQSDVTGQPLGSLYDGDVDAYTERLTLAVSEHADALDGEAHRNPATPWVTVAPAKRSGRKRSRKRTSERLMASGRSVTGCEK